MTSRYNIELMVIQPTSQTTSNKPDTESSSSHISIFLSKLFAFDLNFSIFNLESSISLKRRPRPLQIETGKAESASGLARNAFHRVPTGGEVASGSAAKHEVLVAGVAPDFQ